MPCAVFAGGSVCNFININNFFLISGQFIYDRILLAQYLPELWQSICHWNRSQHHTRGNWIWYKGVQLFCWSMCEWGLWIRIYILQWISYRHACIIHSSRFWRLCLQLVYMKLHFHNNTISISKSRQQYYTLKVSYFCMDIVKYLWMNIDMKWILWKICLP